LKYKKDVPSVVFNKIYRLRSSVALVYTNNTLDFFKTNLRESTKIEINYPNIVEMLLLFDGNRNTDEIFRSNPFFDKREFVDLISYLNDNCILIEIDENYSQDFISNKYRTINLLEDFFKKTSDVIKNLQVLSNKSVMVIGLGAVGTWVIESLARLGVKNFIIVDNDKVELSNLHRQNLFFYDDVGKFKVDCVEKNLNSVSDCNFIKVYEALDVGFFDRHKVKTDLIINCADYPSVDTTSNIIGKACMELNIPHLIGGGYNLHLTLIGQAVIPYQTACVKCFDTALRKINDGQLTGVRKLKRLDRKIGSFGPLCAISASITAIEAFKMLIEKYDRLVTAGKRMEFRVKEQDFFIKEILKDENCSWCGKSILNYIN
jgi:molybdopterin/thiamine biosynthesis adenylyltransferase